jgi:protein-disulfide isomerase
MHISRRGLIAALPATAAALTAPSLLCGIARAAGIADVAKPQSLADMALGSASAPVTIVEYAAPTCPHCARFNEVVFPRIRSEFIDTGKVRYVFREFPLNIKDVGCAMLARRVAMEDPVKYFAVIDAMFRQQDQLVQKTADTLKLIGKQAGLSAQAVEDCLKDQALMDRIAADQKYASEVLKVEGTPTFFINAEILRGEASFEEFDKRIKSLLKS